MPFSLIPFLLLLVPIVEIGAFIVIGGQIGVGLTLLMILVTAIIGTYFLRAQGLSLINQVQSEMQSGRVPGRELGHGAMILVAGIFLLTPGFVTDTLGFLLFVPLIRDIIWKFTASRINISTMGGPMGHGSPENPFSTDPFHNQGGHNPMEGDGPIVDLDEEDYTSQHTEKNTQENIEKNSNHHSPWRENGNEEQLDNKR